MFDVSEFPCSFCLPPEPRAAEFCILPSSFSLQGWGGVFTPLEPYRRTKPIKTGIFSFSSRDKAVTSRGKWDDVKRDA